MENTNEPCFGCSSTNYKVSYIGVIIKNVIENKILECDLCRVKKFNQYNCFYENDENDENDFICHKTPIDSKGYYFLISDMDSIYKTYWICDVCVKKNGGYYENITPYGDYPFVRQNGDDYQTYDPFKCSCGSTDYYKAYICMGGYDFESEYPLGSFCVGNGIMCCNKCINNTTYNKCISCNKNKVINYICDACYSDYEVKNKCECCGKKYCHTCINDCISDVVIRCSTCNRITCSTCTDKHECKRLCSPRYGTRSKEY